MSETLEIEKACSELASDFTERIKLNIDKLEEYYLNNSHISKEENIYLEFKEKIINGKTIEKSQLKNILQAIEKIC